MLEHTIKFDNFTSALTNYLKTYQLNTTKDVDLFEKFTEAVQNNPNIYDWNGQPLNVNNYLKPWFYKNTFPIIKVVTSGDGLSYNLQQIPFIQSGLDNNTVYLWNIPIFTEPPSGFMNWLVSQKGLNNDFPQGWTVVNHKRRAYARVL